MPIFLAILLSLSSAQADSGEKKIVSYLQGLSMTRESLASSLDAKKEPITEEDFKRVCAPVGMSLKKWAGENGYSAKQIAKKYRNEKHKPNPEELAILQRFEKNPSLKDFSAKKTLNGTSGTYTYVRINVTQSCLHCHGAKEQRPEFIQKKYRNDLAWGFKPGDLRGIYAVFTSETKAKKP